MREILTIIAGILIALLTAALVGPYFVDWNGQRAMIEQRLSEATGAKVQIAGPIDLKLLPTPSLRVEDLSATSRAPGGPSLHARRADFELAVAPLLRGEIQFLRADVDAPRLRLPLQSNGEVALPGAPRELPRKLELERLRVHDATVVFDRGGRAPNWSLNHINFDAQAASLDGPFSGSGRIGGKSNLHFQFSAGAREGDRMRLEAVIDSGRSALRSRFQGVVSFTPAGAETRLSYDGLAALRGTMQVRSLRSIPWRIAGRLLVDGGGAKLKAGELSVKAGPQALSAQADGAMTFGASPKIRLALKAQQLDLDRFLAGEGKKAGQIWLRALGGALSEASFGARVPWPISLSLKSTAVLVGGETLTATKASLVLKRGTPRRIRLTAAGPGESHLAVDGSLETGPAAALRVHVDVGAQDTRRFAKWIAPALPNVSARLEALPFHVLGVSGNVELSAASFAIRNLVLDADRTTLRGSAAYTRELGAQRARLFADLRSDSLDLDSLPDLTGPAKSVAGMDLSLSLNARAVRLARFGQGMIDAGRIDVQLTRTGSNLRLKKLSISDVGGADFSATGAADDKIANLDATLDATRLADLAALVNRVAPGSLASALAARATALSPARLALHVRAVRRANGDYRPNAINLAGSARGVRVRGKLVPDAKDPRILGLELGLEGPDSAILLRQLGLETLPIADSGKGKIEVALRGRLDRLLSARVDASLAGSNLTFQGQISGGLTHPLAKGALTVKSGDAVPLLRLLTIVLPDASLGLPASFKSDAQADAGGLALSSISGKVGGARVAGNLRLATGKDRPRLDGALSFDRLSLGSIASLAVGPPQPARPGALWSNARLAPGLADPPSTNVTLSIARFSLGWGWAARQARMRLEIGPGVVSLKKMSMRLDKGGVSGALSFRRDGRSAAIAGAISLDGMAIDRPSFSGRVTGSAQFTATGSSASRLVYGLAGHGDFTLTNLVVPRTDPGALARVVAMTGGKGFTIDQKTIDKTLSKELDRGPLRIGSCPLEVSAAGGEIRLATKTSDAVVASAARAEVSLGFDLRALRINERITLRDLLKPKDWTASSQPHVAIVWNGLLSDGAPVRSIEAGDLVADLSARAIARENRKIMALKADIQERAFFNRRLSGLRFLHRREREEAAFEAQQAQKRAQEEAQRAKAALALSAGAQKSKPAPRTAKPAGGMSQKPTDLDSDFWPAAPPLSSLRKTPEPARSAPAGFGSDPLSAGPF